MTNSEFKLSDLLRNAATRMWQDLSDSLIPHATKRGEAREAILREFLARHLPQHLGVSTGFVFDADGNVSKQADVVIHDRLRSPQFPSVTGEAAFFPCESVVCVGQVKSELRSRKDLEDALDNLRSVKVLNRSAGNAVDAEEPPRPLDQVNRHLDQIFTFVFATKSAISADMIRDTVADSLDHDERHLWTNIIFVFDRALVTYACPDGVCPNTMHALGIGVVKGPSREELLLSFFLRLAMAVQVTTVGRFAYAHHLWPHVPTGGTVYFFGDADMERVRWFQSGEETEADQ